MSERLLPPREACRRLGIHFVTLKRWIYSGKIRAVRTPSGRWMIPESEIERIVSGKAETRETKAVIYARVSSSDQKADLERQIQYLTQYCLAKGYRVVDVLSDVASGLRADRKGLLKLFDYVVNRQVDVVVVTHRDRLTRFGFEYLDYFFRQFGIRVETVYDEAPVDERQELVEDLIAVITDFANRLYGMRSRRKKELVDGFRKLLEEVEESG
ncbi:IS607 family transposase [Vulcanisaeta sp. JCM 14467]